MDDVRYSINEEYDHVVMRASEKFGYSEELQNILIKVLPAMLEGKSYEERLNFYRMLSHTQIVVIPPNEKTTSQE